MPTPLWKLICPRDNWRNPVEFPGEALDALKAAADRLGLVRTVDEANRKFYLDKPSSKPAAPAAGSGDLTPHFDLAEFHSKDGVPVPTGYVPRIRKVAQVLEKIRTAIGASLVVTSGYRSPAHNAAVGGVPNSEHTKCLAADIYSPELEAKLGTEAMVRKIIAAARAIPEIHGIGVNYSNFVHVDIRPGERVEW